MSKITFVSQIAKKVVEIEAPGETSTRYYITSTDGAMPRFEPYIEDDAYGKMLSGAVIKCVDVIVIDPSVGEVMVATRRHQPMAGDWAIGGRKRAGETDLVTAVVNLKRELGIDVDPNQLVSTPYQSDEVWDTREQAAALDRDGQPVTACHMSATNFVWIVDKDSLAVTHNDEYSSLRWVPTQEILTDGAGKFHPAFKARVQDAYDICVARNSAM